MSNFLFFSISLTLISNIFYHLSQKSVPASANPVASVVISYLVALIATPALFWVLPQKESFFGAFKTLNWSSIAVGLTIIGVDLGYLLVYRAGGKISHTAMMVTLFVTLLLLPVGLIFFQEKLTLFKSLGIILGLVALIFLNI